jgi:hypothetical protein
MADSTSEATPPPEEVSPQGTQNANTAAPPAAPEGDAAKEPPSEPQRKQKPRKRKTAVEGVYGTNASTVKAQKEETLKQREGQWDRWESEQEHRLRSLPRPGQSTTGAAAARSSPRSNKSSPRNAANAASPRESAAPPKTTMSSSTAQPLPIAAPSYAEDCRQAALEWLRRQESAEAGTSPNAQRKAPTRLTREGFVVPVVHDTLFPPAPIVGSKHSVKSSSALLSSPRGAKHIGQTEAPASHDNSSTAQAPATAADGAAQSPSPSA